jgi:hypothetical protein
MIGVNGSYGSSNSQSSSLDESLSTSGSFSDSLAQAIANASSQGTSQSGQTVFNGDVLQNLYQGATQAAGTINPALFSGETASLFNSGSDILDKLGVGAGEDYLSGRLTDDTAQNAQLDALSTGLGNLFKTQLNPAITGDAVAAGQLGGSRQGVAQGVAAGQIAQQYASGAASIIGTNQAQKDAAATNLISGENQAAGVGVSALTPLLNTATAGSTAALAPYGALASILGPATTLTSATSQNTSQSMSQSEQIAQAISQAIAASYGTSESTSSSHNTSFGFSDRRVKKHVTRVGSTPGGIPLYTFRYLWDADDAPLRTGVMADEVQHIPGAVHDIGGVLAVDYARVA